MQQGTICRLIRNICERQMLLNSNIKYLMQRTKVQTREFCCMYAWQGLGNMQSFIFIVN